MDRRFESRSGAFGPRAYIALLACAGVALTLGVAALFAASAPSFAAARSYATGRAPCWVALGDLNGDRKPDLATANGVLGVGANTVSVLLNRGDGSFQAKLDYRTGAGPCSVAIGDLNGDGNPDLATANFVADTVSVLLNRGDGGFQATLDYRTGNRPISVAIGDLNGDGNPDLAIANQGGITVSVLLNSGDGSFQAKHDYATGDGPNSVAIGDLNGDGTLDLVTANEFAAGVSVLLNSGGGSFRAKRDYRTGQNPNSVAIGDLNGDGTPDLATANVGDKEGFADAVSVLANRGDGTFRANRDYRTGRVPLSVAIGDLNRDGKPDLVTSNFGPSTVSVLANRGDGSFQAKLDYRTGHTPYSVAMGDLNGDGKPDLATANSVANTVSVLVNTPGLCTVQDVFRQTLPAAKRTIARANCRVGKIRRAYSKIVPRGRVISQKPKPGTVLPTPGKVNLIISRGRKR
jgi:hypothetical protein